MAATVMQIFLKPVLETYFHPAPKVRLCAAQVAVTVLRQGLIHVDKVSKQDFVQPRLQCWTVVLNKQIYCKIKRKLKEI